MNEYALRVAEDLRRRYAHEPEYLQAVLAWLELIDPALGENPEYERLDLLARMVEPDRIVTFLVPWVDDQGRTHTNHGYRVQFSNALGPYKGGLRFQPGVNLSVVKFLGFEQTYKNALIGLPVGGAAGGADFDPRGRSRREVMRFCQSFMNELYKHIGQFTDVPAGDIGVGAREVGYLFGQYRRITGTFQGGTITGKGIPFGGSLARTQATGYGLCYFAEEALKCMKNDSFAGKTVVVSGSGNVATYAAEKATQLGGKVVAMCDSNGYVYDANGIDLQKLIDIKQRRRARIKVYADEVPGSEYHEGCHGIWGVKCDIALPCATQNEMDLEGAKTLIANGCMGVFEGANMPLTPDAIAAVQEAGLLYSPGKASNAGGVATSGLEMTQNSMRLSWSFEEVDEKLQGIMNNIFHAAYDASVEVGKPGDLMVGANVAGFLKVANAMLAQGVV